MKYRNYPKLLSLLENLEANYNNEMDLLDKLEEEGKVFVIRPTSTKSFDRFEQDLEKLSNLYNDGYNTCQRNIEKLFNYLK
jgi:predicted patatin/cPLA2 family phospholipase